MLSECEVPGKVPLIDVKQLHSILMKELKLIDSSSTIRANLLQEIQVILNYIYFIYIYAVSLMFIKFIRSS